MESDTTHDEKEWNTFLIQSFNTVREVSPSVPIGHIYTAAYKQFQLRNVIMNDISHIFAGNENKTDNNKKGILKKATSKKNPSTKNCQPKKSQYQQFLRYYMDKMKSNNEISELDKKTAIAERWNKLTPLEKEKFFAKHKEYFDELENI